MNLTDNIEVLNLYACLGGNRFLWKNCNVTAVERDPELARLYQERFPDDKVICGDAHQYLLNNYKKFGFIWSSPPCPTHSRIRFNQAKGRNSESYNVVYPDMTLYQEIIFLDNYFDGKYCVENVIPYYNPLIQAQQRGRHLYWTNFILPNKLSDRKVLVGSGRDELNKLCNFHKIDLSTYKGKQTKIKIARNLVDYEAGNTIFNIANDIIDDKNKEQLSFFS